jgi:hypothetical protein
VIAVESNRTVQKIPLSLWEKMADFSDATEKVVTEPAFTRLGVIK